MNLSRLILCGINKNGPNIDVQSVCSTELNRPVPQPYIFRWLRYQYETELIWIRQIRQELQQMEVARQWAKS
jgi:hypothetical protein